MPGTRCCAAASRSRTSVLVLDSAAMSGMLEGKVAIVTGGGGGIGSGVARLLASESAAVVVNDPGVALDGSGGGSAPADQVVSAIEAAGGRAVASYASITDFDAGSALVQQTLDTFGRLDIVATCHGILRDRMLFNMTPEEWDEVIDVHLTGTFNVVRHACTHMRGAKAGRIITVSSTSGLIGNPGQANYGAAKSGIGGFTKVVARDMGRYGVTANCIVPVAATRMTDSVPDEARERRSARGISRAAIGSGAITLDPEGIAPFFGYLASDAAGGVNGQFFYVHGNTVAVMSQPRLERTVVKPEGFFGVDELRELMPGTLVKDVPNPAPRRDA